MLPRLSWLLAALMALFIIHPAFAQLQVPRYYPTDLGSISGPGTVTPTAINRFGHIVGYARTGKKDAFGSPVSHAFLWTPEKGIQDLGALNSELNNSAALAINDHDDVVGWSDTGVSFAFRRGFIYHNNAMQALDAFDVPPGDFSFSVATGINNNGLIVGYSQLVEPGPAGLYSTFHAVRFDSLTDLGALLLNPDDFSLANAVNDDGWIVGASSKILIPHGSIPHATRFDMLEDLHTASGTYSSAYAINAAGNTVGQANFVLRDGVTVSQAYLLVPGGAMQRLGAIYDQETQSLAEGLNNQGQVVGKSFSGILPISGFVWDAVNGMQDLNRITCIGVGEAVGINDAGQIAAVGGDALSMGGGLLLTPIAGGTVNAPDNLNATAISCTDIQLSWNDNSDNEGLFAIELRGPGAPQFVQIDAVCYGQKSYTAHNLLPNSTYEFRVRALGVEQNSDYSNIAQATTLFIPANAPTSLTATDLGNGTVQLSWMHDGLKDVTGFVIERKNPDSNAFTPLSSVSASTRNYTDTVQPDSTYSYRVRALNICGASDPSNIATLTTCPVDVTALVSIIRSSLRYNPSTKRYIQIVAVKNITAHTAILAPIRLVLDNLSGGVTLANKSGDIRCNTPNDRPYILVTAGTTSLLSPGASITLALEFAGPPNATIAYSTRLLAHGTRFVGGGGGGDF